MRFTKMHGLGNDFIMIDAVTQVLNLSEEVIRKLANRHTGVGCDQLLLVEPPSSDDVDFRYRIFNSDGGEVENCGNGARCFARFVRERRLTGKSTIAVETKKGKIILHVQPNGDVTVDMGVPILTPSDIPFVADQQAVSYQLTLDQNNHCNCCGSIIKNNIDVLDISVVSMGNPHAVLRVADAEDAPLQTVGIQIQTCERFPKGVNVGFMAVLSRTEINLRVLERGVGETLACGTGACAAVVAGILRGWLDNEVSVNLPGGHLKVKWLGKGHSVIKTGSATTVFEGNIIL